VSGRVREWVAIALALGPMLVGCATHRSPEPSAVATTVSPAGSEILARRCAACHARPDPGRLSAEQWQAALERMKRKVTLPAAEWDTLAAMR
jgi:cytochrome c5